MYCLLYSPKQKIVKFHAQKQIGKSHVIDIFTSEDMEAAPFTVRSTPDFRNTNRTENGHMTVLTAPTQKSI